MSEIHEIAQHLEELRKRVLRIIIVIAVITVFILTFHAEPIEIAGFNLYYPVPQPINNIAAQITNFMKTTLVPTDVQLIQTAPGQAFFAQVYIAALVGLVCTMPVIIRESIGFLKPALKEREINISRTIVVPAFILFVIGCAFSYLVVIPYILDFLYQYGDASGLITFLNVVDFVTFVLQFLLATGVSFQLPLIMYALSKSGLTDAKFWRNNIRYAIVAIVIVGAAITPDGSGVTMWFISGPMIALYMCGIIVVERASKKDKPI